jgi:hypothetical protein
MAVRGVRQSRGGHRYQPYRERNTTDQKTREAVKFALIEYNKRIKAILMMEGDRVDAAKREIAFLKADGLEPDSYTINPFVQFFAQKKKDPQAAVRFLEESDYKPDIVAVNILIRSYADQG